MIPPPAAPPAADRNVATSPPKAIDRIARFFYDPDEQTGELQDLDLPSVEVATPTAQVERRAELLAFRLRGESYAIPIENVREIVKPPALTELPRVRPEVLGVISLRGEALPVFSLVALLRLPAEYTGRSSQSSREERIVVIETAKGPAGLWVEAVEQVIRLGDGAIEPPPRGLRAGTSDCLDGIGRLNDRLYAILSPEALFAEQAG
ncbi:MAG: chemotaxis protein CheW [Deltaproteobacteria bacterium]